MQKTAIEWALNPDGTPGYTWNPITGCLNGCDYCYARKLANTRLKERYLANEHFTAPAYFPLSAEIDRKALVGMTIAEIHSDPFYPRFWPERCTRAGMVGKGKPDRKGIFVCDMSDLFGIGIPEDWTRKVLSICQAMTHHRFYLLTKQPQNLIKFSPFPDNCWVGVTAWNETSFVEAYNRLICIEAMTKFVSLEPFLGWGRLYEKHACKLSFLLGNRYEYPNNGIDWLIIGAQTKPYKPPKTEWVREIVEAANKASIPVFLKNNLKPLLRQNNHNLYSFPEWAGTQFAITGDHSLSPVNPHQNEAMRNLRQEMPK